MQAQRITAELIDMHLRDRSEKNAFPEETASLLNKILDAIEKASEQCTDIPYQDVYVASPVAADKNETSVYPGWEQLSLRDQIAVVEDVIAKEIRPYIELDEGGVEVADIVGGKEVCIIYQGSCTSCYSATGSTLNAIQQILRSKVHPDLVVIPDAKSLFVLTAAQWLRVWSGCPPSALRGCGRRPLRRLGRRRGSRSTHSLLKSSL